MTFKPRRRPTNLRSYDHDDEDQIMSEDLCLYTIGHSNISVEDFLALLRKHNIAVVVDVRSTPSSQYVPHFNKPELERFLKANGLDYRFAGEYLGGRPTEARHYKAQIIPDADTKRGNFLKLVDYIAMMQDERFQRGITRLIDILHETHTSGNTAIMCSEGEPRECHRHHLITRALIDPNVKVIDTPLRVYHILKDGTTEALNPSEFQEMPIQRPLL